MNPRRTIESVIKEVAETFQGYTYLLETMYDISTRMEKCPYPLIGNIIPDGGTITLRNGRLRDAENVSLVFLDKVRRGADGRDNEKVYNRMKMVAGLFMERLNATGFFEGIESVNYGIVMERLSTIVTGVQLTFTLRMEMGVCLPDYLHDDDEEGTGDGH